MLSRSTRAAANAAHAQRMQSDSSVAVAPMPYPKPRSLGRAVCLPAESGRQNLVDGNGGCADRCAARESQRGYFTRLTRTTVGSDAQESPDPTGLREGPRGNQGRLPRLAPAEMLSAEPIHRVNALTTLVWDPHRPPSRRHYTGRCRKQRSPERAVSLPGAISSASPALRVTTAMGSRSRTGSGRWRTRLRSIPAPQRLPAQRRPGLLRLPLADALGQSVELLGERQQPLAPLMAGAQPIG